MATKIKAVKCPQCGSEKHEKIDEKAVQMQELWY